MPLMSVARNFFLGREPLKRVGSVKQLDIDYATATAYRELRDMGIELRDAEQPVGTLVGRRAPVPGDRARHPFRRQGADPRRADLGARRASGVGRAQARSSSRRRAASA